MIHPPAKFHTNPLSHFFSLHASANTGNNENNNNVDQNTEDDNEQEIDLENDTNSNLTPDLSNAKSTFTIAAILGLKKNGINPHHNHHHHFSENENLNFTNGRNFNNVMNLSMNQPQHNQQIIDSSSQQQQRSLIPNHHRLPLPIQMGHHHHGYHQQHLHHHSGSSALQSLQQLQQQHTNNQIVRELQNRDKLRHHDQNQNKKTSLKNKRVRTIFTPEQLERLEAEFERQQYMVGPERLYLAHTLQLTEAQVKVWFQNRRIKWRKHHLEITQQRLAIIRQRQVSNGAANPMSGGHVSQSPGANISNSTDSTAEHSGSEETDD